MDFPIVIIGVNHHNTYGIIRCFAEIGVKPDVILCSSSPRCYITKSKLTNKCYCLDGVVDIIDVLKQDYQNGAIIFTCSDEAAIVLDSNFDSLSDRFRFFNAKEKGAIAKYMDKQLQEILALEYGFKVPISLSVLPSDIDENVSIPFPCIIKPLRSVNASKNDITRCNNYDELKDSLKRYDIANRVLLQEFIIKDCEIVLTGVSINGEIYIPAIVEKYRDIKGATTFSKIKPISELPNRIIESTKTLIKKINYEGLFGVELIKCDNEYYFIEINLRNDATTYSICCAGINLPAIFAKHVDSDNDRLPTNENVSEIYSMVEFNDFIHVLKRNVSLFSWIKDVKKSKCLYCYNKKDKRVFYTQLQNFISFLFKRLLKKSK